MTIKIRLLLLVLGGWFGYQLGLISNGTLFGFAERLFGSYQLKGEMWWLIGICAILTLVVGAFIRMYAEKWMARWEKWIDELSVSGMLIGLIGLFLGPSCRLAGCRCYGRTVARRAVVSGRDRSVSDRLSNRDDQNETNKRAVCRFSRVRRSTSGTGEA